MSNARQRLGLQWLAGNGADTTFARQERNRSGSPESGCAPPSPAAVHDVGVADRCLSSWEEVPQNGSNTMSRSTKISHDLA